MSGIRSIRPAIGAKDALKPEHLKRPLRLVPVRRVMDFDVTPGGPAIGDGSELDTLNVYAPYGVSLRAGGAAAGGHVCAKAPGQAYAPAHSGANVLALRLPASHPRGAILIEDISEAFGVIRASFDVSVRWVCIQAAACTSAESFLTDPNAYRGFTPYLKAFDENGATIGTAEMPVSALPPLQPSGSRCSAYVPLAITASGENIRAVEFSCRPMSGAMDSLKVLFDTLSFEFMDVVRS
jgi:hypothetical protein